MDHPVMETPGVEIRRATEPAEVLEAAHLFDSDPEMEATRRFLLSETHHLLLAYAEHEPVGMITGVETTHPDKGTEMFLYELEVDAAHRGRGIGTALVRALAELARRRGCYGMWVGTEHDNVAALATYAGAEGVRDDGTVLFVWHFDGAADAARDGRDRG